MEHHPRIIVQDSVCAACAVPTKRIFHRHFPELWAEGGSVAESAERLAWQLAQALDGAPGHWHRLPLQKAACDVAEFMKRLAGVFESGLAGSCAGHGTRHVGSIFETQ